MDPFWTWQDDFKREVDEVLASAKAGPGNPAPPASAPAAGEAAATPPDFDREFREAKRRLSELEPLVSELRGKLAGREAELFGQRARRERLKSFLIKLRRRLRALKTELTEARLEARAQARFAERLSERLRLSDEEISTDKRRLVDWARDARAMQARMDELLALLARKAPPQ